MEAAGTTKIFVSRAPQCPYNKRCRRQKTCSCESENLVCMRVYWRVKKCIKMDSPLAPPRKMPPNFNFKITKPWWFRNSTKG
ncbi:Hypothetical predicted protein [Paramuricea clavata]|nr:Hypothetical predicted protein [Paramuricea clavata]